MIAFRENDRRRQLPLAVCHVARAGAGVAAMRDVESAAELAK